MSYKLCTIGVIRLEDGAWIPAEPLNQDYGIYLDWVAQGNTPDAADKPLPPPPPTPSPITDKILALLVEKNVIAQADADAMKK